MAEGERKHSRRLDLPIRQDDRCSRRNERRDLGVRDEAESPVDGVRDAERRRELEHGLDGLQRISGDDEPDAGDTASDLRQSGHEHVETLVPPDEAEEEKRGS